MHPLGCSARTRFANGIRVSLLHLLGLFDRLNLGIWLCANRKSYEDCNEGELDRQD